MWLQKSSSVLLRFMCRTQDGVAPGLSAVPSGKQPSQGPHTPSSQPAVGRARQQTHCVMCESSHGGHLEGLPSCGGQCTWAWPSGRSLRPQPTQLGKETECASRQIPAQVPRIDHTTSDTPAGRTQLSPWLGTLGTGSDGLEASARHTQVCPVCTGACSPAGTARRSWTALDHWSTSSSFCINIPVCQMHTAIMPISDRKEVRLRLRKVGASRGCQSEREDKSGSVSASGPPCPCSVTSPQPLLLPALAHHHQIPNLPPPRSFSASLSLPLASTSPPAQGLCEHWPLPPSLCVLTLIPGGWAVKRNSRAPDVLGHGRDYPVPGAAWDTKGWGGLCANPATHHVHSLRTSQGALLHACVHAKTLQSGTTLCDPMDCSLPGPSVCRFLQARILKWVATPSSKRSSWSKDQTWVSCISCIGRRILNLNKSSRNHSLKYGRICGFFRFFSHLVYYRGLHKIPCAVQWVLFYYVFINSRVYMLIRTS